MASSWRNNHKPKLKTPDQAASAIKNGDRVYLGSICAEPRLLTQAIGKAGLDDVELIQLKAGAEASELAAKGRSRFRLKTFSVIGRNEEYTGWSESDYTPLFHSEIPRFIASRRIPIDVAVIQVSEPDRFGQVSLGISVDITRAAVESARTVIAQVNPNMPRTLGDTHIPLGSIDHLVETDEKLIEIKEIKFQSPDEKISRYASELIEDGSIIQIGFAALSKGFSRHLLGHKNLGVHSEMITDSLVDLYEAGVITNSTKKSYRGKSLTTFCLGTKRLYDFVDNNLQIEFHPSDVVLNPAFIASNEKMVAINLALQVDLRGQIRQGSLGWTPFEGSGGEQDFMRGASMSKGGRSVVCLRSTDRLGRSNIVPSFGPRAAVIMNRGDVNYVVTEFGAAYLGGKTIRERCMALIDVAHPDHREDLVEKARELGYLYKDQYYCKGMSVDFRERIRTDVEFKGGLKAHIRPIKCTDESMLRDLFYHLSQGSVYFRYFSPRRSMPHGNVQKYVNVSEDDGVSIVALVGPRERRRMIAEARCLYGNDDPYPDFAIMVDENYQGLGIGKWMTSYLVELIIERGAPGMRADVLSSNSPMMKVFESLPYEMTRTVSDGAYSVMIHFDKPKETVSEAQQQN
jgi:acyl-CoA hydrolase